MPRLNRADGDTPDAILDSFLAHVADSDIELYDHQEEAILQLYSGANVILNTPTGSGKSLVALALQYLAWSRGKRSIYTVPIKALANEKFLSLSDDFGPESVGLITGDATINSAAPIIVCTAEILAQFALRDGAFLEFDEVIIDEFHYYADRDRGAAWQIPLLTLPQGRFLLMSATFGSTDFFKEQIKKLTGKPAQVVRTDQRPVPLLYSYSET
ncbi:MAG: DEAD/DEAH box helicase, partial [Verrucomicrobiota bacterium]